MQKGCCFHLGRALSHLLWRKPVAMLWMPYEVHLAGNWCLWTQVSEDLSSANSHESELRLCSQTWRWQQPGLIPWCSLCETLNQRPLAKLLDPQKNCEMIMFIVSSHTTLGQFVTQQGISNTLSFFMFLKNLHGHTLAELEALTVVSALHHTWSGLTAEGNTGPMIHLTCSWFPILQS